MTQKHLPLENVHLCAGCEKNGRQTQLSGAQAAKTQRMLKMKLCPRCLKIARAYIASRRKEGLNDGKNMDKVMEYGQRIKAATSAFEVDDIILEMLTGATTKMLILTVNGLAKRRREELTKANNPA